MKIHWGRIVIAAIWSELLLFAIYLLAGFVYRPDWPAEPLFILTGSD